MSCDAPHAVRSRRFAEGHGARLPQAAARAVSALLLAGSTAAAHAGGTPVDGRVQPYPSDWPPLAGMSSRCAELAGRYLDPIEPDRGGASPQGGIRYGAWAALGFASNVVRANDPLVTTRHIVLEPRPDGALDVRYLLDGVEVVTRGFPGSAVACGSDGLALTAFDRQLLLPPKFAIRGPDTVRSTLYRVGEHLYVKTTATTRSRLLGVVPLSSTVVAWQRFEVDAR